MLRKEIKVFGVTYSFLTPEECPFCHRHGDTQPVVAAQGGSPAFFQIVFQCSCSDCHSYFIGYYLTGSTVKGGPCSIAPLKPVPPPFPETTKNISPQFLSIYLEAETARSLGLTQIAGPGYRKAFEFLIKDYAKSLFPAKNEEIEKNWSNKVVCDYISDKRVQACAKRTLWLGNDETHYLRKWENHDLQDLIKLIRLTIDWIDMEIVSQDYIDDMPGATK